MYISLSKVSKEYSKDKARELVLSAIDLEIAKGEFLSIIGPSGCGKSTLLRLISGIEDVTDGEIRIDSSTPDEYRKLGQIGMVFQKSTLLPWRNVRSNVRFPLELAQGKVPDENKINSQLEFVEMLNHSNKFPETLSGGMVQRVEFARALVGEPKLILLDEPFSQLDEISRNELISKFQKDSIEKTSNTNTTIIFVTHSIHEAVFLSDRVVVMSQKPAQILDIIDVSFVRPRSLKLLDTSEFTDICKSIRELLKQ